MNRLPLLAAFFAASALLASCGNDTADDADDMATDTTMMTTEPMATDGTMNGTMGTTDTMMMSGGMNADGSTMSGSASAGTVNADGSTTYSDGVIRRKDGSYTRANGTVMTDAEVKSYQSVQGKVITTDGTVRDRDADGRVGTAEVKEEYKQGRDAVKGAAKDVKEEVKR